VEIQAFIGHLKELQKHLRELQKPSPDQVLLAIAPNQAQILAKRRLLAENFTCSARSFVLI
jgi:hypothetical protein